jgi:phosphoglycolate phosphatase
MASALGVRNVIFDLDGTLVDSRPGIVAGMRYTLRQLGHELPPDYSLDWAIGPPLPAVMAQLLAAFEDGRVEEAVACYRAWYRTEGLFDAAPYPGVAEVLDRLTEAGKVLFVGTSKRAVFARPLLEHFDLARRFRAIYGADLHGRLDHKVELIQHLLVEEGLDPGETVLVGDREYDVAAARANGLRSVGVTYGYGSREELLAAGAGSLCDTPARLYDLL